MSTAPKPLRIKRITLTDFRAFPGPAPVTFNLDEKNLLVYGENGAGKSSLFHALREFFSCKPLKKLVDHKNVFSGEPDTACSVEIEFNDGKQSAKWHIGGTGTPRERHPTQLYSGNDPRVVQTALRRACIDYRALLDTNYLHGDKEINLFRIAVEHVLADFPATISGGTTRTLSLIHI